MAKVSDKEKLLSTIGMEPRSKDHLQQVKQELQVEELLGLGLWIDGTPFNWDRTESLEIVSFNLPGVEGKFKNLRIPCTVIPKGWVATGETFDDILELIVWSLQHLALGIHPARRHDKKDWMPGDDVRRARAKSPLRIKACLVEVRGDWLMMKEVFHLPAWNELAGCCWLCKATPDNIRNAAAGAPWRDDRLSHWELVQRILEKGFELSPLLSAPGIKSDCFKIDWLHAVDQGVAADFLGNLLKLLCSKMVGANNKEKRKALFGEIKQHYAQHDVQEQLQTLTAGMIQAKKAPPKLRAKAAEVRALIPFAKSASDRFLSDAEPVEKAAKEMAKHLNTLYGTLSGQCIFRQDLMQNHCNKFCLLYAGLEEVFKDKPGRNWRIKPKFHLMQELCEMTEGSNPALSWTYRDEDFGGSMATMTRQKGGKNTVYGVSHRLVSRFRAKHDFPAIS